MYENTPPIAGHSALANPTRKNAIKIGTALLLLAIALTNDGRIFAEEMGFPLPPEASNQSKTSRPAQKSVLLNNGNVFQGAVKELGDQIRVSRNDGSVINLNRNQVRAIAPSLNDLYRKRIQGRFSGDIPKFQSDARWCLRNGLLREAAADVLHAKSIDPINATTLQLLRQIAAQIRRESAHSNQPMTMPAVQTVSHQSAVVPVNSADSPEHTSVTKDSDRLPDKTAIEFRTKIQPILQNRCVSCHSMDSDRGFKIRSATESRLGGKRVAEANLNSVMEYIDLRAPSNSVLRHRATDLHGGRAHSFGSENSAMLRNLDRWLSKLPSSPADAFTAHASAETKIRDQRLAPTSPPELWPIDNGPSTNLSSSDDEDSATGPLWQQSSAAETTANPDTRDRQANQRLRRTPAVKNPFDPEIFNRKFHGSNSP